MRPWPHPCTACWRRRSLSWRSDRLPGRAAGRWRPRPRCCLRLQTPPPAQPGPGCPGRACGSHLERAGVGGIRFSGGFPTSDDWLFLFFIYLHDTEPWRPWCLLHCGCWGTALQPASAPSGWHLKTEPHTSISAVIIMTFWCKCACNNPHRVQQEPSWRLWSCSGQTGAAAVKVQTLETSFNQMHVS